MRSERSLNDGISGIVQHLLEMFRRSLSEDATRHQLDRVSNRLTKITAVLRRLDPPGK
jgi:hypothetical protein